MHACFPAPNLKRLFRAAEWRHTPVAVKILYQDAQAEDRELFEREVKMMATLHQYAIARVSFSV